MNREHLAMVRELNVIWAETEHTITASSPCAYPLHDGKVKPAYWVTFGCQHGERQLMFCAGCTAQRRAYGGPYACRGDAADCAGARVTRVASYSPFTLTID